ncbi:MAG: hypothetical protein AAF456_18000 [Planctomycetota bacterium]
MKNPEFAICVNTGSLSVISWERGAPRTACVLSTTSFQSDEPGYGYSIACKSVADSMFDAGYRGRPVVLGLNSFQVLFMAYDGLQDRNPTRFDLEEVCAIDAENMEVCRVSTNGMLAAISDRIQPLVVELEKNEIQIGSIVPTPLLLTGSIEVSHNQILLAACDLATTEAQAFDLLEFDTEGLLKSWSRAESPQRLKQLARSAASTFSSICTIGSLSSELGEFAEIPISEEHHDQAPLVARECESIRRGIESRVDFANAFCQGRASKLAPAANFLLTSVLVLLVATLAASLWRTHQFDEATAETDRKTVDYFNRTLPDRGPTRMVNRVLEQEKAHMLELNRTVQQYDQTPELLANLHNFLESLPRDVKFETKLLNVTARQVRFEGVVSDTISLDRIKDSIDSNPQFNRTNQTYGTNFALTYAVSTESRTQDD